MRTGQALLAALFALAACGGHRAEESEVETFRFELGPGTPRIEARIDSGSIEVLGSSSPVVEVTFHKRARSLDPKIARALIDRIEVGAVSEENRVRLTGRIDAGPERSIGSDLRADVIVRAPIDADLDLRTDDGRLRIERIQGTIVAETGDGRISVVGTSGSLMLRTDDGSIVGRDVRGTVDAVSDDGRIEIDGSFDVLRLVTSDGSIRVDCRPDTAPSGDWTLRTGDGSVRLSLPRSISVDIEATTSDGRIENRLSGFAGTESRGRLRGKTGLGGVLVFVSTMDGRIELTEN
jgi:hypothetical protein